MFQEILKTEVAKTCFFSFWAKKCCLCTKIPTVWKCSKRLQSKQGVYYKSNRAINYCSQMNYNCENVWQSGLSSFSEILENAVLFFTGNFKRLESEFFPGARGQWGCAALLGLITKNQTIVITALHFIQILNSQINAKFNHKLTSYNNDFYYLKHKLNLAWNYTNTVGKFLHYTLTFNKNFFKC